MKDDQLQEYIDDLIPDRTGIFAVMEAYATENNVPIMESTGIEAMLQILRVKKPRRILEVGTAIGYSALRMAFALPETKIVTIERDEERLEQAKKYIHEANKEAQIDVVYGDALEVSEHIKEFGPFDALFIDAAKGQYKRFFEMYTTMLHPEGVVITDNVLFKGLVAEKEIENKRIRNLVKKIDQYNRWLMNHSDYHTVILPVGDGIAISLKRWKE